MFQIKEGALKLEKILSIFDAPTHKHFQLFSRQKYPHCLWIVDRAGIALGLKEGEARPTTVEFDLPPEEGWFILAVEENKWSVEVILVRREAYETTKELWRCSDEL